MILLKGGKGMGEGCPVPCTPGSQPSLFGSHPFVVVQHCSIGMARVLIGLVATGFDPLVYSQLPLSRTLSGPRFGVRISESP